MAVYDITLTFRVKDRANALERVFRRVRRIARLAGLNAVAWNARWVDTKAYHERRVRRQQGALARLKHSADAASGLSR